jgi:hypothetical protein
MAAPGAEEFCGGSYRKQAFFSFLIPPNSQKETEEVTYPQPGRGDDRSYALPVGSSQKSVRHHSKYEIYHR